MEEQKKIGTTALNSAARRRRLAASAYSRRLATDSPEVAASTGAVAAAAEGALGKALETCEGDECTHTLMKFATGCLDDNTAECADIQNAMGSTHAYVQMCNASVVSANALLRKASRVLQLNGKMRMAITLQNQNTENKIQNITDMIQAEMMNIETPSSKVQQKRVRDLYGQLGTLNADLNSGLLASMSFPPTALAQRLFESAEDLRRSLGEAEDEVNGAVEAYKTGGDCASALHKDSVEATAIGAAWASGGTDIWHDYQAVAGAYGAVTSTFKCGKDLYKDAKWLWNHREQVMQDIRQFCKHPLTSIENAAKAGLKYLANSALPYLENKLANQGTKAVHAAEDWLAGAIGFPVCHDTDLEKKEASAGCDNPLGVLEDEVSKFMCKKVGAAIGSACEKVAGAIAKAAGATVDGIEDELVNHA
jgi:hypothetical protein